jgi:Tfp pilus assembly protein PilF
MFGRPASSVCWLFLSLALGLHVPLSAEAQSASVPIDSLYDRAERAAEAGSTDTALRLYGDILARDSSETQALRYRAHLYAEQKQYGKAAGELKRVQQLDSDLTDGDFGNRGWYLILAGDDLEAARDLSRQAMERDPSVFAWPLNLGHTFLLRYQPKSAKIYYRKAIERIETEDGYQSALSDFDTFVEQGYDKRRIWGMKDWFRTTYLSEGGGGDSDPLAFLGTWITIVVGLVSLFQKGEEAMTGRSRNAVRDWILHENLAERASNWAAGFKDLFDAIFTEHHFSWVCFYRSSLASAILVTILLLGMVGFEIMSLNELAGMGLFADFESAIMGSAYAILFGILFNLPVDYASLFQTRWVIQKMAETNRTILHLGFLLLDAVLTISIFFVWAAFIQIIALVASGQWVELSMSYIQILGEVPFAVFGYIAEGDHIVTALFISTFFTSVWIWLYAVAGFATQETISLFRGVDWMSEFFDVENRPVQALGLMLAVLTTGVFLVSAPFVLSL